MDALPLADPCAPRRYTNLPTDRRRFLKLAAACATTLWLPRSAWGQTRFASDPFALGVASGSPTHDSVVLWTRLAPEALFSSTPSGDPITVRWEIAHDDKFDRIVQRGQSAASAALADSVHVEVAGLEPDRWYFYRFMAGDAQSTVGRTRTFPAPDAAASRLRIGYASCQRWEHGYFSAYRHMRQENPDVVLFLGDYIYEYPNAKNAVRVPTGGWVRSLADIERATHSTSRTLISRPCTPSVRGS
jgi:alkaline phosphatase D